MPWKVSVKEFHRCRKNDDAGFVEALKLKGRHLGNGDHLGKLRFSAVRLESILIELVNVLEQACRACQAALVGGTLCRHRQT